MAEAEQKLFRKKSLEKISSPEELSEYLHVTNPGVWMVLLAVILLLAGVMAWSWGSTLETTVPARAVVEDGRVSVLAENGEVLEAGMTVRTASAETVIGEVMTDPLGRSVGLGDLALPDGKYDALVVTERIRPISFLLESR